MVPGPAGGRRSARQPGVRFDANKGTPMKERFSLDPESDRDWLPLAREALDFARSVR